MQKFHLHADVPIIPSKEAWSSLKRPRPPELKAPTVTSVTSTCRKVRRRKFPMMINGQYIVKIQQPGMDSK